MNCEIFDEGKSLANEGKDEFGKLLFCVLIFIAAVSACFATIMHRPGNNASNRKLLASSSKVDKIEALFGKLTNEELRSEFKCWMLINQRKRLQLCDNLLVSSQHILVDLIREQNLQIFEDWKYIDEMHRWFSALTLEDVDAEMLFFESSWLFRNLMFVDASIPFEEKEGCQNKSFRLQQVEPTIQFCAHWRNESHIIEIEYDIFRGVQQVIYDKTILFPAEQIQMKMNSTAGMKVGSKMLKNGDGDLELEDWPLRL